SGLDRAAWRLQQSARLGDPGGQFAQRQRSGEEIQSRPQEGEGIAVVPLLDGQQQQQARIRRWHSSTRTSFRCTVACWACSAASSAQATAILVATVSRACWKARRTR